MRTILLPLLLAFALPAAVHAQEGLPKRAEFWVDMLLSEPVEKPEYMWEDLRQSDVIYLGETHRLKRHHRLQVEVLREMLKGKRPVILGLEQIEKRDQPQVDRYNKGEITFEQLAVAIDWTKQWNNYPDYKVLIETAREGGARVIGLNAPRELIREVGKTGVDSLPKEKRLSLPETIHLDDPTYERLMNQLLSVHSTFDPSFLRHVYEAQVCRDEHMAATMAEALAPKDGAAVTPETKPLGVVVAGAGHVQFGLGTPDRVRFRIKDVRDRILLMSESGDLVLTPEEEAMRRAVQVFHQDVHFIRRPAGDYLHVKELAPEPVVAKSEP